MVFLENPHVKGCVCSVAGKGEFLSVFAIPLAGHLGCSLQAS